MEQDLHCSPCLIDKPVRPSHGVRQTVNDCYEAHKHGHPSDHRLPARPIPSCRRTGTPIEGKQDQHDRR